MTNRFPFEVWSLGVRLGITLAFLLQPAASEAGETGGTAIIDHPVSAPIAALDWSQESTRTLDDWLRIAASTGIADGGEISASAAHAPELLLAIHAAHHLLTRDGPSLMRRALLVQLLSALHHVARRSGSSPLLPAPAEDELAASVMAELPDLADLALADLRWQRDRVLAVVPVHRSTLQASARAARDAGDWPDAIDWLSRCLARDPSDALTWRALAEAHANNGSPESADEARKKARSLLQNLPLPTTPPEQASADASARAVLESTHPNAALLREIGSAASNEEALTHAHNALSQSAPDRSATAQIAALGLLTRGAHDSAQAIADAHLRSPEHRFFRAQLATAHGLATGKTDAFERARALLLPLPSPTAALLGHQLAWIQALQVEDNDALARLSEALPTTDGGGRLGWEALPGALPALWMMRAHHALIRHDAAAVHDPAERMRRYAPLAPESAYYAAISALLEDDMKLADAHVNHGLTMDMTTGTELALRRLGIVISQNTGDLDAFRRHLRRIAALWPLFLPPGAPLERSAWNPSVRVHFEQLEAPGGFSGRLELSIRPVLDTPLRDRDSLEEVMRQHGLLERPAGEPASTH